MTFLGRNVADYNVSANLIGVLCVLSAANEVGYMVLTSNRLENSNIGYVCGNGGGLWVNEGVVAVFDLPALEGVRELIVIRLGGLRIRFRRSVILNLFRIADSSAVFVYPVNGVLVSNKGAVEANVLRRHGELTVNDVDNGSNIGCRSPAGEGVTCHGRLIALRNNGVNRMVFDFAVLYAIYIVGYLEIVRNPLCVQVPVGSQSLGRTDCHFLAQGAGWIGVPAAESVAFRSGKHIVIVVENGIGIAGGSGYNIVSCAHVGDSAIVRVISYSNRNTGNVAVNVVATFIALILDGVPYDADVVYVEVVAQYRERVRGIGTLLDVGCAIFRPVLLVEETQLSRRNQIVGAKAVNVVDTVGRVVVGAIGISNRLAFRSQMAFVTGLARYVLYAAVRSLIRQVACPALACAARRSGARRQKYEIPSLGQFRFRLSRGVGSPPCSELQVVARHQVAGHVRFARCFIIPAVKVVAFALSGRNGDWHVGINFALRVAAARDFAAVFVIGQIVFLCGNVNIDSSVELGLGKVKAELILAVDFVYLAELARLELYIVDGVIGVIANLTDSNRRNLKGLVVPELPGGERLTVIDTAINDDLIGYAAAIRILCIFLVNRPVRNIDLNHLRIFSANQIVEYQLVGQSEFSPRARVLGTVLKLAILVSNVGNFGTELGLVIVRPGALMMECAMHASLPENGVVLVVVGVCFARFLYERGNGNAVFRIDLLDIGADGKGVLALLVSCVTVGNPHLSITLLGHRGFHREVGTVDKAVGLICRVLRLVVYVGSAVCCTVVLRIVFRNVGRSVVIARLFDVLTGGRSFDRGFLNLGFRRRGNIGSFGGVCFNGSGIYHGKTFVHEWQRCCDVLSVGQRPGCRAHGQHHDSRKSSCEQTFARILF